MQTDLKTDLWTVFVCISPLRVIYCEPGKDQGQDEDGEAVEDEEV